MHVCKSFGFMVSLGEKGIFMFHVVFQDNSRVRQIEGPYSYESFENEQAFEAWYVGEIAHTHVILEKGISLDRCAELVRRRTRIMCELEEEKLLRQAMSVRFELGR
jgi:hypothetical protein